MLSAELPSHRLFLNDRVVVSLSIHLTIYVRSSAFVGRLWKLTGHLLSGRSAGPRVYYTFSIGCTYISFRLYLYTTNPWFYRPCARGGRGNPQCGSSQAP